MGYPAFINFIIMSKERFIFMCCIVLQSGKTEKEMSRYAQVYTEKLK